MEECTKAERTRAHYDPQQTNKKQKAPQLFHQFTVVQNSDLPTALKDLTHIQQPEPEHYRSSELQNLVSNTLV